MALSPAQIGKTAPEQSIVLEFHAIPVTELQLTLPPHAKLSTIFSSPVAGLLLPLFHDNPGESVPEKDLPFLDN